LSGSVEAGDHGHQPPFVSATYADHDCIVASRQVKLHPLDLFTTARKIGQEISDWYRQKNPLHCNSTPQCYQMCAWRLHRCTFLPFLPRPIRNRPQRRSCTRHSPIRISRRGV